MLSVRNLDRCQSLPRGPVTDTQNLVNRSSFNTSQKTNVTLKLLTQEHLIKGLFTDLCSQLRKPTRDGEAPRSS